MRTTTNVRTPESTSQCTLTSLFSLSLSLFQQSSRRPVLATCKVGKVSICHISSYAGSIRNSSSGPFACYGCSRDESSWPKTNAWCIWSNCHSKRPGSALPVLDTIEFRLVNACSGSLATFPFSISPETEPTRIHQSPHLSSQISQWNEPEI